MCSNKHTHQKQKQKQTNRVRESATWNHLIYPLIAIKLEPPKNHANNTIKAFSAVFYFHLVSTLIDAIKYVRFLVLFRVFSAWKCVWRFNEACYLASKKETVNQLKVYANAKNKCDAVGAGMSRIEPI